MPVTQTARLKLQKQAAGDPNWAAALNAGFDLAEDRFATYGAVAGAVGYYLGQIHIDPVTTPPTLYICTVVGTPGTFQAVGQLPFGYAGVLAAILLNNTIALQGKESGGTARNLAAVSAANKILIGAVANQLNLQTLSATSLKADYSSGEKTIWHEGNDGAGSGLDADFLRGLDPAAFHSNTGAGYFEAGMTGSTFFAPAYSSSNNIAHGFGAIPHIFQAYLRCITIESSYNPGDLVRIDSHRSAGSNGVSVSADSVNIYVAFESNFSIVNKFGGAVFTPTIANWRVGVRAWK